MLDIENATIGITGVCGAAGSYLAEHLTSNYPGVKLHGYRRGDKNLDISNITLHDVDLLDFSSTLTALYSSYPDIVFHLASNANVRASFSTPLGTINNNVMCTANLFEAFRYLTDPPIVVLASSSEVYGISPYPMSENTPIAPINPYACSKAMQDHLALTYYKAYHIPIIRLRNFGYWNPRRADIFSSSFARQIAEIEQGKCKVLQHGDLSSQRTFVDVEDICWAYILSALHCTPGEAYNVGGSEIVSVEEVLEQLITKAMCSIPTKKTQGLLRPIDTPTVVPSVHKFKQATGWEPAISLDESLDRILSYWRRNVERT